MPINLGDGIISVLVETAQANAQLEQFGASVPAKMAPAAAAFTGTSSAVQEVTHHMVVGQQGARELGEVMNLAGETSRESMYQARGEMMLVDELLGVKLPRHVVSFIAEIPGVGAALSAAFQATAVLFIIEAIAKGIEKIIEWREEAHKLELAQLNFGSTVGASFIELDEKLLRTGIKADELRGDHLAALAKELQLINLQTLHDLSHEFETLSKAADALFKNLETHWFTFNLGAKGAENALKDFLAQYNFLLEVDRDKTGAANLLAGTKKQAEDVLTLMQRFQSLKDLPTDTWDQINQKSAQEKTILEQLHKLNVDINDTKARTLGIDEKTVKAQEALVATFAAQENAKKKIEENEAGEEANKKQEEYDKIEAEQERALKAQLAADKREAEEEDKLEDDRRNKYIADFQEREKEKIAATRAGSEERMKILDASMKEEEAHGFQDTAFYKSLQVQKVQAVQARIAQEQKAELDAEKRDLTGAEQDAKREVETAKESGREQEKALQDLGRAKVLSQNQTSKRLIAAYEDEKNKVLAILNNLLREEQALMEKATNQLNQAKLNPGVTPEQVSQAETMLKQIQNAVANTEAQIAKVKSDANVKELALERNYYGQALAMAIAFGRQDVAAKLASNHAALLDAQGQLTNAKARGLDTVAIEHQIKSLQKLEKELIKEAATQKGNTGRLLHEFAQTSTAVRAYEEELDRSGQKTAAWGAGVGTVISEVAQIWAQGGITIEQALARMAAAELNAIAQVAEKEGTKQLALAFGSWPDGAAMAHHFAAAGLWFALGGGLSAASGALSGGGGSKSASSSPGGTPAPSANSPGASAGTQPTQVINVVHLASGGLVEKPTLVVIGDRGSGGGGSREAVVPLDNRAALSAIAGAISAHMHSQPISIQLQSDIPALAKVLSRKVDKGEIRLLASNSIRVTKRS